MIAIFYVIAVGFVAAGLLQAFHMSLVFAPSMVEVPEQDHPIVLHFNTFSQKLWSMIMCTIAGPYLLLQFGLRFWRRGIISTSVLAACSVISTLWCFFTGVVLVELALYARLLLI